MDEKLHERISGLEEQLGDLRGHLRRLEEELEARDELICGLQERQQETLARRVSEFMWRCLRYVFRRMPLPSAFKSMLRRRFGRQPGRGPVFAEPLRARTHARSGEEYRARANEQLHSFLADDQPLILPSSTDPVATVILVLYNQASLTFVCLRSLLRALPDHTEIVIVDNASTDETPALLDRLEGPTLIRNEDNLHFLRAVNQGAARARGKYLVLLNNDAELLPGSLEAALDVFEQEQDVGAVGGRIIFPSGRLQEAGCIIWRDASCRGYGRDDNPDDGRYLHRRQVDFCSGVFLVTPRSLFESMGGFDEDFTPAYYEETDYCMRLNRAGYRVIYEPGAEVIHLEFGSSSHSWASDLMERNQGRFLQKHGDFLRTNHYDSADEHIELARSVGSEGPRVLFVDDRFPHRDLGQGFPRANALVREMVAAGADVTVFATNERVEPREQLYRDLPPSVECLSGNRNEDLDYLLRSRGGMYDVLFVSRPHNMEAVRALLRERSFGWDRARWIYDAEAVFCDRWILQQELHGRTVSSAKCTRLRAEEFELADRADIVTAVTETEAAKIRKWVDAPVRVLGTEVDVRPGETGFDGRHHFLFVGAVTGDETPNADSLVWFLQTVWPILREALPGVCFRVAGLNESPAVQGLAADFPDVELLGRVPDLGEIYDSSRVFVAPTRYGSGIPLKCLEAAAFGIPMVTTKLIADQLGWRDGCELMCASHDDPARFAERCANLHGDRERWEAVQGTALERVADQCSPEAFGAAVRSLLMGDSQLSEESSTVVPMPVKSGSEARN